MNLPWTRNRTTAVKLAAAFVITGFAGGLLGYMLAETYPPPPPSVHVVETAPAAVHPGALIDGATASCDIGETLLGGGYRVTTVFGGDPNATQLAGFQVFRSMPSPSVNGYDQAWQVRWASPNQTSPDLRVIVFAICQG